MTRWQELVVQELREQAEAHYEAYEAFITAVEAIEGPRLREAPEGAAIRKRCTEALVNEACERASVTLKEAAESPFRYCTHCGLYVTEGCRLSVCSFDEPVTLKEAVGRPGPYPHCQDCPHPHDSLECCHRTRIITRD